MSKVARCSVANHNAAALNATNPMLSPAAARSASPLDDHGARNDNDLPAVHAASAFGAPVHAGTAATLYLDDHAVRTLAWCKRRSLREASRYSQNKSKCDNSLHSSSPCVTIPLANHDPGNLAS
jgi:hypothetical protein